MAGGGAGRGNHAGWSRGSGIGAGGAAHAQFAGGFAGTRFGGGMHRDAEPDNDRDDHRNPLSRTGPMSFQPAGQPVYCIYDPADPWNCGLIGHPRKAE